MFYKPNKRLGQNFLLEQDIAIYMADAIEIEEADTIIEIGAGLGALTEALVSHIRFSNSKLFTVEIDERFIGKLREMYLEDMNVNIVHDNFLQWFPKFENNGKYKVIGSLPFYITSPILHSMVKKKNQPESCVFLIQKEVAEKVAAETPKSSYLSTFVQTFYNVTYLKTVSRQVFKPVPKVDGGIIKLERNSVKMSLEDILKYEGFLHRAFASPRKMLNKPFTKEELQKANLDGSLRPQNISPDKWLETFHILVD